MCVLSKRSTVSGDGPSPVCRRAALRPNQLTKFEKVIE
jgi:hypothetical protein